MQSQPYVFAFTSLTINARASRSSSSLPKKKPGLSIVAKTRSNIPKNRIRFICVARDKSCTRRGDRQTLLGHVYRLSWIGECIWTSELTRFVRPKVSRTRRDIGPESAYIKGPGIQHESQLIVDSLVRRCASVEHWLTIARSVPSSLLTDNSFPFVPLHPFANLIYLRIHEYSVRSSIFVAPSFNL